VHIVQNAVSGIKTRARPESIALSIAENIGNLEVLNRLGAQEQQQNYAVYRWDRVAQQTAELFEKTM